MTSSPSQGNARPTPPATQGKATYSSGLVTWPCGLVRVEPFSSFRKCERVSLRGEVMTCQCLGPVRVEPSSFFRKCERVIALGNVMTSPLRETPGLPRLPGRGECDTSRKHHDFHDALTATLCRESDMMIVITIIDVVITGSQILMAMLLLLYHVIT
jgi:hypothetical protein